LKKLKHREVEGFAPSHPAFKRWGGDLNMCLRPRSSALNHTKLPIVAVPPDKLNMWIFKM